MLFDITYADNEFFTHQDLRGVLAVANDLYERHPETFGKTQEDRDKLENDIRQYTRDHPNNKKTGKRSLQCYETEEFFKFFVDKLTEYHLNPFENVSLAYVGGWEWREENPKNFLVPAKPVLDLFGSSTISTATRQEQPCLRIMRCN